MTYFATTLSFPSTCSNLDFSNKKKEENQVNIYYDKPVIESDMEKRAIEIVQKTNLNLAERVALNAKILTEQFQSNTPSIKYSKEQVDDFLIKTLPNQIQDLIFSLDKINFSRSYEKPILSYPSIDEFTPFVEQALKIKKDFNNFRKIPGFKAKFNNQIEVFFKVFKTAICTQTKNSRLAQREAVHNDLIIVDDKEFELACIERHLDACDTQANYYWLELRNLLNLQQLSTSPRQCTHKELEVFMFLTLIYDHLNEQE